MKFAILAVATIALSAPAFAQSQPQPLKAYKPATQLTACQATQTGMTLNSFNLKGITFMEQDDPNLPSAIQSQDVAVLEFAEITGTCYLGVDIHNKALTSKLIGYQLMSAAQRTLRSGHRIPSIHLN